MKQRLFFFLISGLSSLSLFAQTDSLTLFQRIQQVQTVKRNPVFSTLDNPALYYFFSPVTYHSLSVNYTSSIQNKAVQKEKGRGTYGVSVTAQTYQKMSKNSRVWGSAYYRKYTSRDVQGVETSDYAYVSPYALGDSIGGDVKQESYAFQGGYAGAIDKHLWGIQMSYRALLAYRDIDPRPKNTVGHLKFIAGYAYALGTHYLATSMHYYRYKQFSSLEFVDELNTAYLYHLTGLGNEYKRFGGDRDACYFESDEFGGVLTWFPQQSGLGVSLGYATYRLTKTLSASNDLPLNTLNVKQLKPQLYYQWKRSNHNYWLKLNVQSEWRKGYDNIFDDGASGSYLQITRRENYKSIVHKMKGSFSMESQRNQKVQYSFEPYVAYYSSTQMQRSSNAEISNSNGALGMETTISYPLKKCLLSAKLAGRQQFSISKTWRMETPTEVTYRYDQLRHNFEIATHAQTFAQFSLRADWKPSSQKRAWYLQTDYQYGAYQKQIKTHLLTICLGCFF